MRARSWAGSPSLLRARSGEAASLSRPPPGHWTAYIQPAIYNTSDIVYYYTFEDGLSILVLSQLNNFPINVIGFAKVGTSTGMGGLLNHTELLGYISAKLGLDQEEVFEFALWQAFWNPPGITGNFTNVQDPIPELEDQHTLSINPWGSGHAWNGNMSAVGIRCTSSSVTGSAIVNGLAGTYTDFERVDPVPSNTPTFSLGVPLMFL